MSRVVAVVHTAAVVVAAVALGGTLRAGLEQPSAALAFGLIVVVGELMRVQLPHGREGGATGAPLASAGALGYALLGDAGGEPSAHGVLQCVAVVIVAGLLGHAPALALGRAAAPDEAARGVLCLAFAASCFQPLYNSGRLEEWLGEGPCYALYVLGVTVLTGLCDSLLATLLAVGRTGWPFGPLLRDQLRSRLGISPAIAATGAVLALAVAVAGLWALPVFCVPLLLTQFSFRRHAAVRATYRQTMASLARSTEVAGYTPHGHARRVAALSRAVGRELGLTEPELTVLEYAALMHDIGQLSLLDPVAGGATEPLDGEEQRRIALLGGAVVRETRVASDIAVIVERQADPYREQPLTARIVRTANAYEDMVTGAGGKAGVQDSLQALERLRLGCARDYEPRVVEALARVVSRGSSA